MTEGLDHEVLDSVFALIDDHIKDLGAVLKQGIESNSPMAHRHFKDAMDRSIKDANQTRHAFLTEINRIEFLLKDK